MTVTDCERAEGGIEQLVNARRRRSFRVESGLWPRLWSSQGVSWPTNK
jgi:hypothetical protein